MSLISSVTLPDDYMTDEAFYHLMESHLPYFQSSTDNTTKAVTLQQASKYRGDFHGLLDSIGIDKKYQYLVTRLNGWATSVDYDGLTNIVILPDFVQLAAVISQFQSEES